MSAVRHLAQSAVQISEGRLREFLQAEVAFFASKAPQSISLREVLDANTPQKAALLSHKELPIRFAQRIMQIEALPNWSCSAELQEVHRLYSETFRDLRLVDVNLENLDSFTAVIEALKGRMRNVVQLLAIAMRRMQQTQGYTEADIGQWLDSFLLSRISTEMLTSQYMACVKALNGGARTPRSRHGIVDNACDPEGICEQAARHARKLVKQHSGVEQDVQIVVEGASKSDMIGGAGRVRFPYVPQYLFYIMLELLKNSARATVEVSGGKAQQIRARPIIITVCSDPSQVAIRVHDEAGGIPFSVADRVWSYMYSTATPDKGDGSELQNGTPLAGYGVGLPLSRLYAHYLGGSLYLQSLPGVGTCAYLYLKRLETEAREELLPDFSRLSSISTPEPRVGLAWGVSSSDAP